MSLSGNQRTRISAGGSGRAYLGFVAKAEGAIIITPSSRVINIMADDRVIRIPMNRTEVH